VYDSIMKNPGKDVRRWRVLVATLTLGCGMLTASGTAAAQYTNPPPGGGSSSDSGDMTGGSSASSATDGVRATQVRSQAGSSLPVTGGDVVALTGMGLAAVGLGVGVLAVRRRHQSVS
jgi:LPXTG-motif cell wall-anchored protein